MKKFILKVGLFLLVILISDKAIGYALSSVANSLEIGGQGKDNYICNKAMEDILIFGSSRAVHHYNAQLIENQLGYTCYNCGEDGDGIILSYGRLLMNKERHEPKFIIYDVSASFDLLKNDNRKYLGWLKYHYDKKGIPEIFESIDKAGKYKMQSLLYRYNSKFLQNLFVYFTKKSADSGMKGFRPVKKSFSPMKVKKTAQKKEKYEFDSLKISYIEKFMDLAGKAKLYVVVSPMWYGLDTEKLRPIIEICRRRGICFIDFSNNPKYLHNNRLFYNGTHLNADGANEFTKDLCRVLLTDSITYEENNTLH